MTLLDHYGSVGVDSLRKAEMPLNEAVMKVISRKDALAQGLKHYFTGKPCKHGHIAPRFTARRQCLECNRLAAKSNYHEDPESSKAATKAWREANKDVYLKQGREYYVQNKERWADRWEKQKADPAQRLRKQARDAAYRQANQEFLRDWHKENYKNNKSRILAQHAEYMRQKAKTDSQFRLKQRLRKRIWEAVSLGYKSAATMELIGCSLDRLVEHLSNQFAPGMTMDNYGEWHVDHIRPCASFDLTDPAQQRECFYYTNLQPLWAEDNIRKSDKWEPATMAA